MMHISPTKGLVGSGADVQLQSVALGGGAMRCACSMTQCRRVAYFSFSLSPCYPRRCAAAPFADRPCISGPVSKISRSQRDGVDSLPPSNLFCPSFAWFVWIGRSWCLALALLHILPAISPPPICCCQSVPRHVHQFHRNRLLLPSYVGCIDRHASSPRASP